MRSRITLAIVLSSLLSPGCTLIKDGCHQVHSEFSDCVEQAVERHRNRKWADSAWKVFCGDHPRREFSDDYAQGFKDGFADYLYGGGDTEPPPLPPAHYRKYRYQTPAGYRAIEDWFAGYRYGANVARDGDFRGYITGPSSQAHSLSAPGEQARHLPGSETDLASMQNLPEPELVKRPTRIEQPDKQPVDRGHEDKLPTIEKISLPNPQPSGINSETTGAAGRSGNPSYKGMPVKPLLIDPGPTIKILDIVEGCDIPVPRHNEQPKPGHESAVPGNEKQEPAVESPLGIELQSSTEQPTQAPIPVKADASVPDAVQPTRQPDFYIPRR